MKNLLPQHDIPVSRWQQALKRGFVFLIGEVHADKDKGRAEEEPKGDPLIEQPPGKKDGGDGIEVDPVRSDNRAEFSDDPVPCEVTEHRGNDS